MIYLFIECIRRIYIWVLVKEGAVYGHVDEFQQQLYDMFGENNKKFALDLSQKYYKSCDKKDVENSFSDYFYSAAIMCFREINKILGIQNTIPINQEKNILLEFLKQSLSNYDEDYELDLIKYSKREYKAK